MNDFKKIKIAQNELEKHLSSLQKELNLNEENLILVLELTVAKIYSTVSTIASYEAYEEQRQTEQQNEFARNLQKEIENKEESN